MPDCGVHYLWFALVCFLIRSHPPSPPSNTSLPPSSAPTARPVQALCSHCDPQGADPDIVQVACYGLGEGCAQGAPFAPYAPTAVQRLGAVLTAHATADAEWESAVCNACSALLKAHAAGAGAAVEALLPQVLGALPMKGDEEEGRYVHGRVAELLEQGHAVVGAHREVVARMARAVRGTAFADEATEARLKALGL